MKTLVIALLLSTTLAAESTPFLWPTHREVPRITSDIAVGTVMGLDAWRSLVKTDKATRLSYACRTGLAAGASMGLKALIDRPRPDGSDHKSFPSQHTAQAFAAAQGWSYSLAVTTGWGRMAAGKHYLTDVLAGAGIGALSQWVCRVR